LFKQTTEEVTRKLSRPSVDHKNREQHCEMAGSVNNSDDWNLQDWKMTRLHQYSLTVTLCYLEYMLLTANSLSIAIN